MTPCFYKPGPAERAYYQARQIWRECKTYGECIPAGDRVLRLFHEMADEKRKACEGQ